MKLFDVIRLVLATALLFSLSGTMAFAHACDHDGGQRPAEIAHVMHAASPMAAHLQNSSDAKLSLRTFAIRHTPRDAAVVTAHPAGLSSMPGCGHGCCCHGRSACAMAGCAAHALLAADDVSPRPLRSGRLAFEISDVHSGRVGSGLDRPPKA
ncbi:hypothetical protein [Hyphomicrobium sp.]|uniref:hypothetical protein n=1 Tax=Hyphomicrobium sp. TaxID=82 RepID=UPI003565A46D